VAGDAAPVGAGPIRAGGGVAKRRNRGQVRPMMTVLTILVGIAMLATFGVLLAGILGMAGGSGDSARSNKLMRWRIGLQFVALALFAILLLLLKR
jgi:hypothetical protein